MKTVLLTAFFSIAATTFAQTGKKKVGYSTLKTFYIDINNDSKTDTIILSSSIPGKTAFNQIAILMSGAKRTFFKAKDQWAEIQPEFLTANKSLVASKNIFIKKTKLHSVIILSGGTDGAGYGGEFSIINIENNNIKMVFDYSSGESAGSISVDVEIPIKLIDLEKNDRLCFVYSEYGEFYKSVNGGQIGTYHPFFVFTVDDDCRYSEALSKTYNEKHYVYVDPKHMGKIEIFYPDDKKLRPRLWKGKGK
ncbi:hypothetical protein HQ865_10815 [Mucilaginibacter mali]|uniref:Uncharacterized protein n=1 Tax=Mucilaginibacter mali TaxID=2740462 RepID=A0A7D4TNW1_9SPHI|nr:hypothetical protein [Mucilaginibacter mali]QKJ30234.1 hypothetical protein HQ865_10815 [Mucilaginibacter mali]